MGAIRFLLLLAIAMLVGCGAAHAERKVALVIGNSAYKSVPRLTNPVNDATIVADMFKKAGFDSVTTKLDVTIVEMRKALREFGTQTRDADVAVIYYAGHGIELDGNNYLIPTDATLETDTDVLDETFPLDRVLFAIEPAKQLRLIILDACRDNPFAHKMKRTVAARAIGRGLAKVEPNNPNTMIAFAAKAGSTASDGDSKNSPFAAALVERLPTPGLDLRKAFGFVRDDVLKNTGYKQEPYVYGSLGGEDVPLVPAKPVASAGPQPNPQDAVRRDYELALQAGDRDAWGAFLRAYPDGFYADLAKVQLKKIAAEEARAAAAEKSRQAEEDKARLLAEGANKAEQEKAVAAAKAAEDARLAAEKAKQAEEANTAAAERVRAAAEQAAADTLATAKAAAAKLAAEKAVAESKVAELPAKQAAEKQAAQTATNDNSGDAQKVASLPPTSEPAKVALSPAEVAKSVQQELRRVGCLTAAADGEWNSASQHSLALFNKYAGTRLDLKLASVDALDAIKARTSRVCPLICEHGYKAGSGGCVKIICASGSILNDSNQCEKQGKREQPSAKSNGKPEQGKPERANAAVSPKGGEALAPFAAESGGCNYGVCLARCYRNSGAGSSTCAGYCNGVLKNFAQTGHCAP